MNELELDGGRARFTVTQSFEARPEQVWPWLTEPARIARWSSALVHMREPFARGAERTVTIRLGPLPVRRLREQITRVRAPHAFGYRGLSMAGHEGDVALRADGPRTQLRWQAEFVPPLRVLGLPMAAFVQAQMRRDLAHLAALLSRERPRSADTPLEGHRG